MTNNNCKTTIAINIVYPIIIIGAIFYFVCLPAISNIKANKNKINLQRAKLEERYIQGQNLKKTSEDIKMIEEKVEALDKIFIKKDEALGFITLLEETAKKNNINQKINLSSSENQTTKYYEEKSLSINTNGSFEEQMKYLRDLENSEDYINIKILELSNTYQAKTTEIITKEGTVEKIPKSNVNVLIISKTFWK